MKLDIFRAIAGLLILFFLALEGLIFAAIAFLAFWIHVELRDAALRHELECERRMRLQQRITVTPPKPISLARGIRLR